MAGEWPTELKTKQFSLEQTFSLLKNTFDAQCLTISKGQRKSNDMLCKVNSNASPLMRTVVYICIYEIEKENILEKQKVRGEKRNYDITVAVPYQQEQKIFENNLYKRRYEEKSI